MSQCEECAPIPFLSFLFLCYPGPPAHCPPPSPVLLCVKVGSHELRSAIRMFPYHSLGVRVPMMALIDWCGFRLLAMPLLPLPPSSPPLLGSSDGGHTVHSSDPILTSIIARIGEDLHLSPHRVGPLTLYTAGDVEGHLGTDGRYYLLDLARCSPPESPALNPTAPRQSVLYRLLRPELLQLMKADELPPLSCDAFTQWGAQDGDVHNSRVTEATRLLYSRYLPALAEKLVTGHPTFADRQLEDDMEEDEGEGGVSRGVSSITASQQYPATFDPDLELQAVGVDNIRFLRLSEELHCHGLNLRHLGLLRHHILTHYHHSPNTGEVALLLLVEAVGRALKGQLRQRLRRCVEESGSHDSQSADYDAVRVVVEFFNLTTSHHPKAATFWGEEVVRALHAQFGPQCVSEAEGRSLFAVVSPHLLRVLSYLCMACGIALSPSCESSLSSAPVQYEFSVVDVELRVGVKAMAISDYAEARLLMAEAALRPTSSVRLMTLAVQILDRLRHSDPFNARYKEEARTGRRTLARMQKDREEAVQAEVEEADGGMGPTSATQGDLWLSSQSSSQSSLRPPLSSSSGGGALIRTGLSTGFARFTLRSAPVQPPQIPHEAMERTTSTVGPPWTITLVQPPPASASTASNGGGESAGESASYAALTSTADVPSVRSTTRKPSAGVRRHSPASSSSSASQAQAESVTSAVSATRSSTRIAMREGKRGRGGEEDSVLQSSLPPITSSQHSPQQSSSPRKRRR